MIECRLGIGHTWTKRAYTCMYTWMYVYSVRVPGCVTCVCLVVHLDVFYAWIYRYDDDITGT